MRHLFAALCLLAVSQASFAQAPAALLKTINTITFGGGYNVPAWIAQRQGFFAKHGVAVNLVYTPDSVYLMKNLIEGSKSGALAKCETLTVEQRKCILDAGDLAAVSLCKKK